MLAGGIPTPLKNMTSSLGMMKFPTEWENKFMFQTHHQPVMGGSTSTPQVYSFTSRGAKSLVCRDTIGCITDHPVVAAACEHLWVKSKVAAGINMWCKS